MQISEPMWLKTPPRRRGGGELGLEGKKKGEERESQGEREEGWEDDGEELGRKKEMEEEGTASTWRAGSRSMASGWAEGGGSWGHVIPYRTLWIQCC